MRSSIAITLLLLAGGIAYSNSFSGVFVFDGRVTLRDNPQIRSLTPFLPLITSPLEGSTAEGRPVANVLSAVNWVTADGATWPFHLSNLMVHLASGLLIFGIIRRTVPLATPDPEIQESATLLAYVAATLWVVHPLTTSAVTYINQRVESLMAMFVLATLYLVIRSDGSPRPRLFWMAAATTCLLAVGSKEVAVVAPLLVLAYDRTFLAGTFKKAVVERWPLYLLLFASWIPLAALVFSSGSRGETAGWSAGVSTWEYLRSQPAMIARYFRLAAWPQPLVFYYGAKPLTSTLEIVTGFVVVGSFGLAALWAFVRRSWLGFAGLFVFLTLAPSSSFVPIATEIGAEHRIYLGLAAISAIVVVVAFELARKWMPARASTALVVAVALLALAFGSATWNRNRLFASETALWEATTEVAPGNLAAWDNLGCALRDERGDLEGALAAFNRALEIDPRYAESYQERGFTWMLRGEPERGLADFDQALLLAPGHTAARFRRAVARGGNGDLEGAIEDFGQLIEAFPNNPSPYLQRGIATLNLGRPELAIADLDRAIELDPSLANAYHARATARLRTGDTTGAGSDVARMRELGSEVPGALQHLIR